jgi:hypothetical protein
MMLLPYAGAAAIGLYTAARVFEAWRAWNSVFALPLDKRSSD